KGKKYGLEFLNEVLMEYGFERVDFVYEPGQYSIRGGILDVFSYSNDNPFRIEFFGDEVDSIRNFDPVNQLSFKAHEFFSIVPNVQGKIVQEINASFLQFVGNQSTIWLKSNDLMEGRLEKDYEKALKIYDQVAESP